MRSGVDGASQRRGGRGRGQGKKVRVASMSQFCAQRDAKKSDFLLLKARRPGPGRGPEWMELRLDGNWATATAIAATHLVGELLEPRPRIGCNGHRLPISDNHYTRGEGEWSDGEEEAVDWTTCDVWWIEGGVDGGMIASPSLASKPHSPLSLAGQADLIGRGMACCGWLASWPHAGDTEARPLRGSLSLSLSLASRLQGARASVRACVGV